MVRAYIAFLERRNDQIAHPRDQVATLQATVTKLEAQLAEVRDRSKQHSGNSSRPPSVVGHRGEAARCPHGHELVKPADLPARVLGPRLTAIGALLHGRYRLSMRETVGVFEDVRGVPVGVGSVPDRCAEVSAALQKPYATARAHVPTQAHANVDETGWKQAGDKRRLWVAVTVVCSVLLVAANRSAAAVTDLVGETFAGVVTSDRYRANLTLPVSRLISPTPSSPDASINPPRRSCRLHERRRRRR